jgi:DNA invertase Pin-like site-specific DNA recombinase
MKAALCARVSTAEEKELQDPETQLVILREYARDQGCRDFVEFVDRASGRLAENRPAFQDMMSRIEKEEIGTVIVLRLDRFMRDVVQGLESIRKLDAAGCSLVLVKDDLLGHVDTSTPTGEFFLTMSLAMGQCERRLIAERTKEGISRYIRENGAWGRRRRRDINIGLAMELLRIKSLSETAALLGVPRNTLRDHLKRAGVGIPTSTTCRNTSPEETDPI